MSGIIKRSSSKTGMILFLLAAERQYKKLTPTNTLKENFTNKITGMF
jgi:hypothetical protein